MTIGNLLMLGPCSAYEGYQTQKLVTPIRFSQMCERLTSSHIEAAIIVFVKELVFDSHHTPFFGLGIMFGIIQFVNPNCADHGADLTLSVKGFATKVPDASSCAN